ncbi:MAG TPA: glycosyltransferase family 39 protein [Chloroflexota bacterium]|nr:glycosyltransferase family 39 protein [Chloroflexota bacterium]
MRATLAGDCHSERSEESGFQAQGLHLVSRTKSRLPSHAALAALLFLGTFALYFATRSPSLDDFDSFNFARAIDHFAVWANQPQPPGYPLYVALSRLFSLLAGNQQLGLLLVSALGGAIAVAVLALIGAEFGAAWAALPLASMPLFWLSSAMALSDAAGLALASVATWLVIRATTDVRWVVAGLAATGLTLGVRPQDAIVPGGVFLLWTLPRMKRLPGWLALAIGAFAVAVLAVSIPVVDSLGGPAKAYAAMAGQAGYVGGTDSLFARPLTWVNVEARLAEFGSVFSAYFGGPRQGGLAAITILAAILSALAIAARTVRWFALAWLLPYTAFMLLFLRPDDPRKVLPTVPPMLLLVAGVRPRAVGTGLCLAIAGWFAWSAFPLIQTLDTVKSPPEQAAAYLASNFSPEDTLVVAGSSFNAIRYRDPEFKAYLLDVVDQATVDRELGSGKYVNLVLLDKEGYSPPESFVGVDTRTFQRDPLVLPKASTVWLAAFRPLAQLRDRDLALPAGPVHIGTKEDVRYVTEGWYRPEQIAGVTARWTDRRTRLRFWVDNPANATLRLTGVAYPPDQQLTVSVNGQRVAQLPMGTDWSPYEISVPAAAFKGNAINVVELDHSQSRSAYDATQGLSLDRRSLAAAYSSFEVVWQ